MSGYEHIKRLAKAVGCNIPELLVLARQNDPFFVGSKTHRLMAEWFAELWDRFGYTRGVHLRRVHYRIVQNEEAPTKHDGEPVGISRGVPRWRLPYRYRMLRLLAPTRETFGLKDTDDFAEQYVARLEEIGLEKIISDLARIGEKNCDRPLVLLCWEKPSEFCHRHLLGD
jgi:Active DUF488-N3 subclade